MLTTLIVVSAAVMIQYQACSRARSAGYLGVADYAGRLLPAVQLQHFSWPGRLHTVIVEQQPLSLLPAGRALQLELLYSAV